VLYHADNFVFRNQYELSKDVTSFFRGADPALDRVAQELCIAAGAAITENY